MNGNFTKVVDYLIGLIKRSELDITFRKYVRPLH